MSQAFVPLHGNWPRRTFGGLERKDRGTKHADRHLSGTCVYTTFWQGAKESKQPSTDRNTSLQKTHKCTHKRTKKPARVSVHCFKCMCPQLATTHLLHKCDLHSTFKYNLCIISLTFKYNLTNFQNSDLFSVACASSGEPLLTFVAASTRKVTPLSEPRQQQPALRAPLSLCGLPTSQPVCALERCSGARSCTVHKKTVYTPECNKGI